jgi:hypothetical protein
MAKTVKPTRPKSASRSGAGKAPAGKRTPAGGAGAKSAEPAAKPLRAAHRASKRAPAAAAPPNIVALPIVRNAISAFESAATLLQGNESKNVLRKAGDMRQEYLRLSLLPPERLLEPYNPPRSLKLSSQTASTVKMLLPEAGERIWAREAAGRVAALSFLTGAIASVKAPAKNFSFRALAESEKPSNLEVKNRVGAYVQVAYDTMMNADDDGVRRRARDSYGFWLGEWNRLNAAETDAAAEYSPAPTAEMKKINADLKATREHLQKIKATAEAIETVARVIAIVAPFL